MFQILIADNFSCSFDIGLAAELFVGPSIAKEPFELDIHLPHGELHVLLHVCTNRNHYSLHTFQKKISHIFSHSSDVFSSRVSSGHQ